MATTMDAIELSKENVQPLRRGRNPDALNTALGVVPGAGVGDVAGKPGVDAAAAALAEQKRQWRADLERVADDPLDTWCKYVAWTEQHSTSVNAVELRELLEEATQGLQAHARFAQYKRDQRYLTLWIKYADLFREPDEIFRFLQENDIGQDWCLFYMAYAVVSETRHAFTRAADLYDLGINRNVNGVAKLKTKKAEFEHRMRQRAARQEEEQRLGLFSSSSTAAAAAPDSRASLGALSAPGHPRNHTGTSRLNRHLGGARASSAQPSQPQKAPAAANNNAAAASGGAFSLEVYVDDGDAPAVDKVAWNTLGAAAVTRKENTQAATAWAGVKLSGTRGGGGGRSGSRRGGAAAAPSALDVFVDDQFDAADSAEAEAAAAAAAGAEASQVKGATLRQRIDRGGGKFVDRPLLGLVTSSSSSSSSAVPAAAVGIAAAGAAVPRGFDPALLTNAAGDECCFEETRAARWAARRDSKKATAAAATATAAAVVRKPFAPKADAGTVALMSAAAAAPSSNAGLVLFNDFEEQPTTASVAEGGGQPVCTDDPPTPLPPAAFSAAVKSPSVPTWVAPECTINTRDACLDIMSMFSDDAPVAPPPPPPQPAQSIDTAAQPIAMPEAAAPPKRRNQRTATAQPASATLSIFSDELCSLAAPSPDTAPRPSRAGAGAAAAIAVVPTPPTVMTVPTAAFSAAAPAAAADMGMMVFRDDEFATQNLSAAAAALSLRESVCPAATATAALQPPQSQLPQPVEDTDAAGSSDGSDENDAVENKENDVPTFTDSAAGGALHARDPTGALQELTVDTQHMDEEEKAEFEAYCRQAEEALRNAAGSSTATMTRDPFVVYGDTDPDAPAAAAAAATELAATQQAETAAAATSGSSGGNIGGEWTQAVDYTGAVVAAFTPELTEAMLAATGVPLSELEGAFTYDAPAPAEALEVVRACRRRPRGSGVATVPLRLGDCTYLLKGVAGVGSAGSVVFEAYPLMDADDADAADDDGNVFALKVETPAAPWEFVAMHRLASRLPESVQPMFLHAHRLHLFDDCTLLLADFGEQGTLADALDKYAKQGVSMEEAVVMFYAIELLAMVEALHGAGMTHNNLRAANLLLRNGGAEWEEWAPWKPGSWAEKGLALVDFGTALDLHAVPGASFLVPEDDSSAMAAAATTTTMDGFWCPQQAEGKPWTYHADLAGVADTVHRMMHGAPLRAARKGGSGAWAPAEPVKRQWVATALWQRLFDELLNAPDELNAPLDVEPLRLAFEEHLLDHPERMRDLKLFLMKQTIMLFSS